jgi:hypothetical protein
VRRWPSAEARQRSAGALALLLEAAAEDVPVYSFNRGVGTGRENVILRGDPFSPCNKKFLEARQLAVFKRGALAGSGPEINEEEMVRAMLLVRANTMSFEAASPQLTQRPIRCRFTRSPCLSFGIIQRKTFIRRHCKNRNRSAACPSMQEQRRQRKRSHLSSAVAIGPSCRLCQVKGSLSLSARGEFGFSRGGIREDWNHLDPHIAQHRHHRAHRRFPHLEISGVPVGVLEASLPQSAWNFPLFQCFQSHMLSIKSIRYRI